MTLIKRLDRRIGFLIGIILLAGAIYALFFIDWRKPPESPPPPVRPLKTIVVGSLMEAPSRRYPGKVRATQRVNLAFQVAGRLIEFPIIEGMEVEKDAILGKLDPRDYENALAAKTAVKSKTAFDLEKVQRLYERKVAAQDELTETQSKYDIAKAEVEIAAKALDDTVLKAPFLGRVAKKLVQNFEDVQAKQPVLSLQDITSVEIVTNVPEEMIALAGQGEGRYRYVANFDYLPDRDFEVRLKEFATEADPRTQTYAITFAMPSPEDVNILPGMTATVSIFSKGPKVAADRGIPVPLDLVPVDGQGQYYVWRVDPQPDKTALVRRVNVKVGEMFGSDILVTDGLKPEDRIAAAGVHLLQEGQRVRPLPTTTTTTTGRSNP
jgi:RND family efflux transporter MFP subunit